MTHLQTTPFISALEIINHATQAAPPSEQTGWAVEAFLLRCATEKFADTVPEELSQLAESLYLSSLEYSKRVQAISVQDYRYGQDDLEKQFQKVESVVRYFQGLVSEFGPENAQALVAWHRVVDRFQHLKQSLPEYIRQGVNEGWAFP